MLRRVAGKALGFLGYAIQYGCIAHCTFEYVGEIVICSGPSMEPTIKNYDVLVCENLSRHFFSIHKGDVIIAKSPNKPNVNICKRVIGLEGDKVCTSAPSDLIKRHAYVLHLGEGALHPQVFFRLQAWVASLDRLLIPRFYKKIQILKRVPKGHVWLEGDNLKNSTDSRSYGPVPYALIRGRVSFRIWPLHSFGALQDSPNKSVLQDN